MKSHIVLLSALLSGGFSSAQQFSISWYTIDGGGGRGQSGSFAITGTAGQPDATYYTSSSSSFSITCGFWSIFAVQTPGAPALKIRLTETNTAVVSWPLSSMGYTLQQNSTLLTVDWVAPNEAIQNDGSTKYIIVAPPAGNRYYRLVKP